MNVDTRIHNAPYGGIFEDGGDNGFRLLFEEAQKVWPDVTDAEDGVDSRWTVAPFPGNLIGQIIGMPMIFMIKHVEVTDRDAAVGYDGMFYPEALSDETLHILVYHDGTVITTMDDDEAQRLGIFAGSHGGTYPDDVTTSNVKSDHLLKV